MRTITEKPVILATNISSFDLVPSSISILSLTLLSEQRPNAKNIEPKVDTIASGVRPRNQSEKSVLARPQIPIYESP